MKTISNIEEFNSAIQNFSVIIFATKSELEEITTTGLVSELESAIPEGKKFLVDFYLANVESLPMSVLINYELMGTPAIAAFSMGEMITSRQYSDPEDFDGWNEDEMFDFSTLPDCLSEFLEDIG